MRDVQIFQLGGGGGEGALGTITYRAYRSSPDFWGFFSTRPGRRDNGNLFLSLLSLSSNFLLFPFPIYNIPLTDSETIIQQFFFKLSIQIRTDL